MGNNNDPIGGNELFQLLSKPSPEVLRVADAFSEGSTRMWCVRR
jgi:hypothetical protein